MKPAAMLQSPATSFDEPLELLAASHERIEEQLCILEQLGPELESRGGNARTRAAAQGVLRYFDSGGALHHEDEDGDLFPLLRARAAAQGRAEIAAAVEELEREHETMETEWRRLREQLVAIAEGGTSLDPQEVARFAWLYRRHMDRESAALLPFAREALDAEERAALGARMAARRGKAM